MATGDAAQQQQQQQQPQQPRRTLKRSKSLKELLTRRRTAPTVEDEELLPCRFPARDSAIALPGAADTLSNRPVKQRFVQDYHRTTDDIHLRPQTAAPTLPPRSSSRQRNTWPQAERERRERHHEFELPPTLVRTQWELERRARRPRSQRFPPKGQRPLSPRVFEQLPREIYDCILDRLEELHHTTPSTVDVLGLQADLKALSLTSKRWHRVAREHLYREVWLPDNYELPKRKLSLQRTWTRLKQLLRTLNESEALAGMVRHLRVTGDLACTLDGIDCTEAERRAAFSAVADIINKCVNLENFSGYCPALRDTTSTKLVIPLAMQPFIKAHAWNIQAAQLGGPSLRGFDVGEWLDCHDDWQHLETLVLCSSPELGLGLGMVSAVIQRLPSLKHLMLSRLNRHDFHNGTLLSLPALKSLRLDHLEGLTDQGIEQLCRTRPAFSLESLSLIGLELTSILTIQRLLRNLRRLRRLTLVQDTSPEPQAGIASANPNTELSSATLEYLHWDVLIPGTSATLVADSIAAFLFPSLRTIKCPSDYEGAIQRLCRPIAHEPLDATDLELIDRFSNDNSNTAKYERFLRIAQIQAQLRVREKRQQPTFNVVVHDENKRVSANHWIGSYVGCMESKIEYSLQPDVEGSHYALVDFGDVEAPKVVYERREESERSVMGEQLLDLNMLF